MIEWAGKTGPRTAALFEAILSSKPHPEEGYWGCLGILRLADKYSPERVERSSARPGPRAIVPTRSRRPGRLA